MKLNKILFSFLLFIYYALYLTPLTIIALFIGTVFLIFIFFVYKNFNLLHLFYVILPSIYKLSLNNYNFFTGVYFFTYLDIITIASILCLIRNIVYYKKIDKKFLFFLYLLSLSLYFVQLVLFDRGEIINNQGFAYTLKSLLFVNAIFFFNQNNIVKLKNHIETIIKVSVIIYITNFFTGYYSYFIAGFIPLILTIKKSYFYYLLFIGSSLILFNKYFNFSYNDLTSFQLIIFMLSSLIFVNFHKFIFKKKKIIFFIINFSIILTFFFHIFDAYLTEFVNNNYLKILYTNNFLYIKLLLDRTPLWLASLDQSNFLFANFNIISLEGYRNAISIEEFWSFGSHNYFIDLYFKTGLVTALFVFLLINIYLLRIISLLLEIKLNYDLKEFFKSFFYILIIIFSVWGFVGNSFSENIGFLFYIIIGSIYSVLRKT